jgi:hypothetical protein
MWYQIYTGRQISHRRADNSIQMVFLRAISGPDSYMWTINPNDRACNRENKFRAARRFEHIGANQH